MEIPMGIFQVKNLQNGKIFIGSSKNLNGIFNRFKIQLKTGCHQNKQLQMDWNKFGADAFEFSILDELKPKDTASKDSDQELNVLEEMWLEKLSPFGESGYNKPART